MEIPKPGEIPVQYDYINQAVSRTSPSTYHTDDATTRFFARYLLQKAMSVFTWTLPEQWSKPYFLYTLYCWGYLAVVKTDKFGVIPQGCGIGGYDVFYQPAFATITNPLLKGNLRPRIGKECTLFRLQPDLGSIMDLVYFYADQMSVCATTAGLNVAFSKLAYVFITESKKGAESFKRMLDDIMSGEAAVFADSKLLRKDGQPAWDVFNTELAKNFIANDVLDTLTTLENKFNTAVGLPNSNHNKAEVMSKDEVNANNTETYSNVSVWLEELQKSCDECNKMFYGGEKVVWVDWRNPPEQQEVKPDEE